MAENSKIEWTDHTFNPWIGCSKVSPGCANCYAETQNKYRKWTADGEWGKGKERRLTSETYWKLPLKWDKEAKRDGVRKKVFCASLADVFDEEVPDEWRDRLFELINNTKNLDWLILTKRPQKALDYGLKISNSIRMDKPLGLKERYTENEFCKWFTLGDNVWLGLSVCTQKEAHEKIPVFLQIPAFRHFLSMEPLLGEINIRSYLPNWSVYDPSLNSIDWVIVGGESGTNARAMNPNHARSLRDQCQKYNTPFFFKQWGEWGYSESNYGDQFKAETIQSLGFKIEDDKLHTKDADRPYKENIFFYKEDLEILPEVFERIGKKKSGRLLDGREWNEMPEVK